MCLIVLAWQCHAHYQLVVAGNRDEYYARPSEAAHWWHPGAEMLAGRDLLGCGTWLGVTRSGRLAGVTNVREPGALRAAGAPSRGALVTGFLAARHGAERFLEGIAASHGRYAGFNLLVATGLGSRYGELWVDSNRGAARAERVAPGIHGLSNGKFDEPWPKVVSATGRLAEILVQPAARDAAALCASLLEMLLDEKVADDRALPQSGVSLELERSLSPAFIRMPGYGTRASTVVLIGNTGEVHFVERSFVEGREGTTTRIRFKLADASISQAAP